MTLSLKTEMFKEEGRVKYTASGAKTAGVPLAVGGRICIPLRDIADGVTDELADEGRFRGVKANETWAAGDRVGWNATGDPVVGTAGTGCWTKTQANWTAGFPAGGIAEFAAAAADEFGTFLLNEFADNVQISGVAGAYKVARGQHTQVAASDTVVTGLTTVVAVSASFDSSPTVKQLFSAASIGDQAGTPAAGSILLKTFKPTAVNDVTPTAATDFTENLKLNWIAIGT